MKFTCIYEKCADHDQTFALINRGYEPDQRSAGQYFETTSEMFQYFRDVLPPMDYTADGFSMCEYATGTLTDAFVRAGGQFYCLCISRTRSTDFTNAVRNLRAHLARKAAA